MLICKQIDMPLEPLISVQKDSPKNEADCETVPNAALWLFSFDMLVCRLEISEIYCFSPEVSGGRNNTIASGELDDEKNDNAYDGYKKQGG